MRQHNDPDIICSQREKYKHIYLVRQNKIQQKEKKNKKKQISDKKHANQNPQ